jgi:hypothetical protein
VLFDPFEQDLRDLIAVRVPHHDVIVAPDSCLGDSIEQMSLRKFGQREVNGVFTRSVDLGVRVEAKLWVRPADLIDAMDASSLIL